MNDPRNFCTLIKQPSNSIHYCIGCFFHKLNNIAPCNLYDFFKDINGYGTSNRRVYGCTVGREHFIYKQSIKKILKEL